MHPHPAADEGTEGWPVDAVEVARVIGAWGVKGWIKLQPFAADPKALFSSRRWHLRAPAHAATAAALPALLHVTQAKIHGDAVVAAARELTERDAAHALRGASVFVARSSFPTAGDDEYYWVDLIDTGPHSVLCVRRPDAGPDVPDTQAERLIPFVAAYVDAVDMVARRIQVDWALDY